MNTWIVPLGKVLRMWWLKASTIIYTVLLLSLNFITIHSSPKWNVALPSASLMLHVSVTSDCVTCSLLSLLYRLTLFLLNCVSLHIWVIMFEDAVSTFSLFYHVCVVCPFSVGNEKAQLKESHSCSKLGHRPLRYTTCWSTSDKNISSKHYMISFKEVT